MTEEYSPGDLVKWYESYADEFMTKDVGYGVIIEKRAFVLKADESPYVNYRVYRTKHADTMCFEERELERVKKSEHIHSD